MTLRNTINALAQTFAEGVLQAIRGASLQEIVDESGRLNGGPPPGTRRTTTATAPKQRRSRQPVRRGPEELASVIEAVVLALKDAKGGMRSEELQRALSLDKKTITRPLSMALADHMIRKTGKKRSTTYFAR